MKTAMTILVALLAFVAMGNPVNAANDAQSGSGTPCANYNALWVGVTAPVGPDVVEVDPGTGFELSVDQGYAWVDWWDSLGFWLGYDAVGTGVVPDDAAFGTICASNFDAWPTLPNLDATWYYQDGF